jgi:hypothetical protein
METGKDWMNFFIFPKFFPGKLGGLRKRMMGRERLISSLEDIEVLNPSEILVQTQ